MPGLKISLIKAGGSASLFSVIFELC